MFFKNKIITMLIVSFFVITILAFDVHADAGPKGDFVTEIAVIAGIPCLAGIIALAIWGIPKLLKKNDEKKVPVTSVLFDQEDVRLKINGNEMEVDASFEYQNTTKKYLKMDLFFPFSSSIQSFIQDISILLVRPENIKSGQQNELLKYEHDGSSQISFDFVLKPEEKVILKVHYLQCLSKSKAEYIITSIKRWKRPVAQATFTVELSSEKKSPVFSFEDGLVEKIYMEKLNLYKFKLFNLYPDKEFQISWN